MKNKFNFNKFKGGSRRIVLLVGCFILGLVALTYLVDQSRNKQVLSYSSFLHAIDAGKVKAILVKGNDVEGIMRDSVIFETTVPTNGINWEKLREKEVEFSVIAPAAQLSLWHILMMISLGMLAIFIWFFIRQARSSGGSGGNNVFTMGKSKAKMYLPSQIKVNFDSVAGVHEAKEELQDVVDFLKNPEKYRKMGAKIPRGVLLVGEPGNGKTLLARAVAGEANCPFFSISGSDFIEVFVGVGAARVRDLFAQARKHAPCIVFIDEIDAVGRQRGNGLGGGNDEREQTLNQLLTEMDGFEVAAAPVIVMAATNRADVLDKALLRPGRFDRRVEVPFPDLQSREQILRVHAKNIKIDPLVDLHRLARGTTGFSGADLANMVNEAAINASKHERQTVVVADFEEARDRAILGKQWKHNPMSEEERKMTAFHEAGHALVSLLLPTEDTHPLYKLTILPRGGALGVTHWMPERDKYSRSKEESEAAIMSALGGRLAEEIVFNKLSEGAYSDFAKATEIAYKMVRYFGMSKLGHVVYRENYSQDTAKLIDEEVRRIFEECYKKAKQLLIDNRDKLDLLATTLLERETMDSDEVYALLGLNPRGDFKL